MGTRALRAGCWLSGERMMTEQSGHARAMQWHTTSRNPSLRDVIGSGFFCLPGRKLYAYSLFNNITAQCLPLDTRSLPITLHVLPVVRVDN